MKQFSQKTHNIIESYLNDSLNQEEFAAFERQMESNEELAKEVDLIQRLNTTIRDKGAINLQKTMNEVGSSFFQNEETKQDDYLPRIRTFVLQKKWAIAATFLFFVVSAFLMLQLPSNSSPSNQQLFAQYYESYDLSQNVRGDEDSSNAVLKLGIQQYKSNDFAAAVQTFLPLAMAEPQNDAAVFSLAHAYLSQSPPKLDLAKQQFERITTANATIYVPKAQWFLALIALKNGNKEQAEILLKAVVESGDDIAARAGELLKELD